MIVAREDPSLPNGLDTGRAELGRDGLRFTLAEGLKSFVAHDSGRQSSGKILPRGGKTPVSEQQLWYGRSSPEIGGETRTCPGHGGCI